MRFVVTEESAVGGARRAVAALAEQHGLPNDVRDRLAIVTTEIAENLARHTDRGGELFVHVLAGPSGAEGLELLAIDRGPGMASVSRALQAGFSTAGGPGLGLGAVQRLSSAYWIDSAPGRGTVLVARVLAGTPSAKVQIGGLCAPHPHEDVCGDGWSVISGDDVITILLADGLGHGPGAAEASRIAGETLESGEELGAAAWLRALQKPLQSTRGAAALVGRIDLASRTITFAGMGNVWGFSVSPTGSLRHLVSAGGIAGHTAPRPREETAPLEPRTLIVMCSDGIHQRWKPQEDVSLIRRHPSLAAGMIYRDHSRGTDDASVLAVRIDT